jgi:hypothetical protein
VGRGLLTVTFLIDESERKSHNHQQQQQGINHPGWFVCVGIILHIFPLVIIITIIGSTALDGPWPPLEVS